MGEKVLRWIGICLMLFGWLLIVAALLDIAGAALGMFDLGYGHQGAILLGVVLSGYQTYTRYYERYRNSKFAARLKQTFDPVAASVNQMYRLSTPVLETVFIVSLALSVLLGLWGGISNGTILSLLLYLLMLAVIVVLAGFFNFAKVFLIAGFAYLLVSADSPTAFLGNSPAFLSSYMNNHATEIGGWLLLLVIIFYFVPSSYASKSEEVGRSTTVMGNVEVTTVSVREWFDEETYKTVRGRINLVVSVMLLFIMVRVLTDGYNIVIFPLAGLILYWDFVATRPLSHRYLLSGKVRGLIVSYIAQKTNSEPAAETDQVS